MEPVRVNPIEGVLNFFSTLSDFDNGREMFTDKIGDTTVDTNCTPDTGLWETGIERLSIEGNWVIVEQYEDRDHAVAGHKKWVGLMTEYPDFPLKDIDSWGLGQ